MINRHSLDKIIRKVEKAEASAINKANSYTEVVKIIDKEKKRILPKVPFFGGKNIVYYLLYNTNDASNVAEHRDLIIELTDFAKDRKLSISVAYRASCPPGNEQQVALALCSDDSPGDELDKRIKRWVAELIDDRVAEFIGNYYSQVEDLQTSLKRIAREEVGLKIDFRLSLDKEKQLEPVKIDSTEITVYVSDFDAPLDLQLQAELIVDDPVKATANLGSGRLMLLVELTKKEIKKYLLEKITISQFYYELKYTVRNRLVSHLDSVLCDKGRRVGYLYLNSQTISSSPVPKELVEIQCTVDCIVQKYAGLISVENTLQMLPQDVRRYVSAQSPNLQAWVENKLKKIIKPLLLRKKYVDILLDFQEESQAIKQAMQIEAESVGYAVQHIYSLPKIEHSLLKEELQIKDEKQEFSVAGVKAALSTAVSAKFDNFEKIEDYLNLAVDEIKDLMIETVNSTTREILRTIDPERFYMRFYEPQTDENGSLIEISVEQELKLGIQTALEERFGAKVLRVVPIPEQTDIINYLQRLMGDETLAQVEARKEQRQKQLEMSLKRNQAQFDELNKLYEQRAKLIAEADPDEIEHLNKQINRLEEEVLSSSLEEAERSLNILEPRRFLKFEEQMRLPLRLTDSGVLTVGGELEFTVYLERDQTDENNAPVKFSLSSSTASLEKLTENFYRAGLASVDKCPTYLLEIPRDETIGSELNIILNAPGFQVDGDNTASLPLDPNTDRTTQTAHFRLTALRPGTATITAELYRGDTFETTLETQVQVTGFDETSFSRTRITTQPRPVPQPDFILRVQTAWNETNSAYRFQYQLRSFRLPSLFSGETNYHSESLSSHWIEQMRGLLKTTLENISDALPEDGRSRLTSLGQYLFQHLLPPELQSDFRTLIPRDSEALLRSADRTFTLLILADQDASLPWELLHDGQRFLSDRFIIGRWFWELNDIRPHEFPVGAINVARYADVEHPELWTALLEPLGSPPPLPLPEGVLSNHDSTEAMRGLHLIRYSQSSDAANRRNAPVTLDDTNNAQDIEHQMRPAKLNLRRNRPLVSLGYVRRAQPELTTLEQTWASAFIRAGCSAFTGSLWAVDPTVEAAFISGFYNRLWTGDSLGEAFHASRQLARAVAPDSLDWLAYVLFGDPMARPYRPVEGKGYAVVEPIGREIDDPLPPGVPVRFRLSLRRTPPVWHEERVIEVAENLTFENLQAHVKTFGLQVTSNSPIAMSLAPTRNYLGWFTLVAPLEMAGNSALVQVFLMDGMQPIHSLMFSLNIENEDRS